MSKNYRIVIRSIDPKRKGTTLKYIHSIFLPSKELIEVSDLLSTLPQVIAEASSLSEAKRIKSELEEIGCIAMFYHPDAQLSLKKSPDSNQVLEDVNLESSVENSLVPNKPVDYTNITHYNLFHFNPHYITQNTYDFVHRYAKAHMIDVPVEKPFNENLALCRTKKEIIKGKQTSIIVGIILIIISFHMLFVSDEEETNYLFPSALFFGGSVLTLTQITSKVKYYDSKKIEEARFTKEQNKNNINEFYQSCLAQARQDYQHHIDFLSTNPSSEEIDEYIESLLKNLNNGIVQLELFTLACQEFSSNIASATDVSLGIGVELDIGALFS